MRILRRLSLSSLVVLVAATYVATLSAAPAAPLAWQEVRDSGQPFDRANAVTGAGNLIFAAGEFQDPNGEFSDWVVRAYDPRIGQVRWRDVFSKAGRGDQPVAIAADAERAIAVGLVRTPSAVPPGGTTARFRNYFVRAYSARGGSVLWQDEIDRGGRETASDVAIEGGSAYVTGTVGVCTGQPIGNCDFFLRAYNAKTGAVLWDDTYDPFGDYDEANAVAVEGKIVAAVGTIGGPFGPDLVVRVYDARTGRLRWDDVVDAGAFERGLDVQVRGGKVVVAGIGGPGCFLDPSTDCDVLVRTYDGASGDLLWESVFDRAGAYDEPRSLAVDGDRAIVVGQAASATGAANGFVAAYNLRTGAISWQDVVHLDDLSTSILVSVAATASEVAVTGGGGIDCVGGVAFSNCDWLVRLYDTKTGALRWADRYDRAGGDDSGSGVTMLGGRVFAAGGTQTAFGPDGNFDWGVRAYDLVENNRPKVYVNVEP